MFELNAKRNPGVWPVNGGLARGYSADGNYPEALKYAKLALAQAPDEANKKNLEGADQEARSRTGHEQVDQAGFGVGLQARTVAGDPAFRARPAVFRVRLLSGPHIGKEHSCAQLSPVSLLPCSCRR